ncbi:MULTISPECIES: hypothetical protein [unclassified Treponema]|nr:MULTISPECIES: hypothetical protein [unclassified Treponema]
MEYKIVEDSFPAVVCKLRAGENYYSDNAYLCSCSNTASVFFGN